MLKIKIKNIYFIIFFTLQYYKQTKKNSKERRILIFRLIKKFLKYPLQGEELNLYNNQRKKNKWN
jgi:hypothetical protein